MDGAEMDDDCHWEDAIDIDDSDLINPIIIPANNPINSSSALPSLQLCSQSRPQNPNPSSPSLRFQSQSEIRTDPYPPKTTTARRHIPGPAGAVQAAMHRKSSAAAAAAHSPIFNSQGRQVNRAPLLEEEEEEEDGDFKLNPWLCAVAFLGRDFELRWSIGSIKDRKSADAAERIPQVVGVVTSCVPNGLGDLFITLKDPTGMVGASIHRNALMDSSLGGVVSVGCVLILKQVAVFCPGRSACYLNITTNNMVKLINKDCCPPDKLMMSSSEARYGAFGKQMEVGRGPMEKQISLTQSDQHLSGTEMRRELNNEKIGDGRTGLVGSLPYNISARDSNMAAKSDHRTNISTNIAAKIDHRTITTTNMIDKLDPTRNASANMVGKTGPRVDSAENMASMSDLRTNRTTDATIDMDADPEIRTKESKKLISTVSVSQWTDEQLLELFADYQDEMLN